MDRQVKNQLTRTNILRPIGYGLLLLVAFDAIASLIPPKFLSATWEFNTIGNFVDRVPLILLGFGAIFSGDRELKNQRDITIWRVLRWLTLLTAILFLLLAPLLIINSSRIKNQTDARVTQEVTQRLSELDKTQQQVKQANPVGLRNNILQVFRNNNSQLDSKIDLNTMTPEEVRNQLLQEIDLEKRNVRPNIEKRWETNRAALVRNTVKWFLGSIVGATLLFLTWRFTA